MLKRLLILTLFVTAFLPVTTQAQWDECIIPPSGPWPPCATGGAPHPPDIDDDCIIPPSGPWPPCATGGTPTPPDIDDDCVVTFFDPVPDCVERYTGTSWAASNASANAFWLTPANPQPGDIVTINWNVTSASDVKLHISSPGSARAPREEGWLSANLTNLLPIGSLTFEMPPLSCRRLTSFTLFAQASEQSLSVRETTQATRPWIFDADALDLPPCPNRDPVFGRMAEQHFERGWMIWSEASDEIIVLMDESVQGGNIWIAEDRFDPSVDPVSDPNIIPPDGLLQPQYGFGKVWRKSELIRDALGWAVAAETNYTGHHQRWTNHGTASALSLRAISGGDGFVWILKWSQYPISWEKTTVRNP